MTKQESGQTTQNFSERKKGMVIIMKIFNLFHRKRKLKNIQDNGHCIRLGNQKALADWFIFEAIAWLYGMETNS